MRKTFLGILSLLLVLVFASTALAGDVIDYQEFQLKADGLEINKPIANFGIEVRDSQGTVKTSVETVNNKRGEESPTPVIKAAVGDTLVFTDTSYSRAGYKITAWDWQYWTDDKTVFEIKSQMDKQLRLEVPGRYHFYLAVADTAPVKITKEWLWSMNWSDNGNHKDIKDLGGGLQGYWYFNEVIVEVSEEAPDFYPAPEGSTTWDESYKTCAKTYTGKAGEQINIPVNLYNAGTKAETDFKATWFGTGWETPLLSAENVEVDKGNSKPFTIPVTVPQQGQETRLVFRANLDGQTPASEINQDNNIMIIKVVPEGVDLAVTLKPARPQYTIQQGSMVSCQAFLRIIRHDAGTEPVKATVTWYTPQGKQSEVVTVEPGHNKGFGIYFDTQKGGTHTVSAEIWPADVPDMNPADNKASCNINVLVKQNASKGSTDKGVRVGLGG